MDNDENKKEKCKETIMINCSLIDLRVDTEEMKITPEDTFFGIILKSKNLKTRFTFIVVVVVLILIF